MSGVQAAILLSGGAEGAGAVYSSTYKSDINSSTHTTTAMDIGLANPDRYVVALIAPEGGTGGHKITSLTIGGVAATIERIQWSSGENTSVCIAYANVPTGTTAAVDMTWSSTTDSVAVALYRIVGYYPSNVSGFSNLPGGTVTAYVDVVDTDKVFAVACDKTNTTTFSGWTTVTEDVNDSIATMRFGFASGDITATAVNQAVSLTSSANFTHMAVSCWTQTEPGTASPWVPSNLSTLRVWYKMNELSGSDGDAVSSLTDSSGYGYTATQATGVDQPSLETSEMDGKNVLRFDRANTEYMSISDFASKWGEGTVIAVLKSAADPGVGQAGHPFRFGAVSSASHYPLTDGSVYDSNFSTTRDTVGNLSFTLTGDHIYGRVVGGIGTAVDTRRTYINGDQVHTAAHTPQQFVGSTTPEMGRCTSSTHWDGYIGEVVVCRAGLTQSDRQKVEGYLAHKWGVEGNLDAGHPYKAAPP